MAEIPTAVEAELARPWAENARLLRLPKLTPQQAAPPDPAQAAYFEAPPGLVDDGSPPEAKIVFYAALFAARTDLCATRFDNPRTGRGAGSQRCAAGGARAHGMRAATTSRSPPPCSPHLKGEVHIGLYPLLDGDKCWWLAADFDGPEAMFDALMYVKADWPLQVPVALEVSRSDVGAHACCSSPLRVRPSWHGTWAPGCCGRPWRSASG